MGMNLIPGRNSSLDWPAPGLSASSVQVRSISSLKRVAARGSRLAM